MGERSGPKSASLCPTLTPTPTTTATAAALSASNSSSVRMPQSFLPFRMMSLVHLTPHSRPQQAWTARHTATAVQAVSWLRASRGT